MASSKQEVAIVVPVYKTDLAEAEWQSLRQTCKIFSSRDIYVVAPENLDLTPVLEKFPELKVERFPADCFKGIRGYNKLMTSASFYDRFSAYTYILIAQLDAYVFTDQLDDWCARGYDYVGAPWLKRPLNKLPFIHWIKVIKDKKRIAKGLYSKIALYDKVGNGGLSLRKVASHKAVAIEKAEELARLNSIGAKGEPEDVFWAMQTDIFTYPDAMEALTFAFDKYPRYSYRLNHHQLPMGCHGWTSRKMRRFWKNHITP